MKENRRNQAAAVEHERQKMAKSLWSDAICIASPYREKIEEQDENDKFNIRIRQLIGEKCFSAFNHREIDNVVSVSRLIPNEKGELIKTVFTSYGVKYQDNVDVKGISIISSDNSAVLLVGGKKKIYVEAWDVYSVINSRVNNGDTSVEIKAASEKIKLLNKKSQEKNK
jgi:hypothetical protein